MASLNERISKASTPSEVETLLNEGVGYEFARGKTQRTWKKTADKRLTSLTQKEEKKDTKKVKTEKTK